MAASKRDKRVERNRPAIDADQNTDWRGLRQCVERSGTGCANVRQSGFVRLAKKMTKVIPRDSDEVGGCRNAYPDVAEDLAEGIAAQAKAGRAS
jgi:hypothetical protein